MTLVAPTRPAAVASLPPLSPLTLRIVEQVRDEGAGSTPLARLIELDPAATIALLRLVNSPFYGMARQVGTVNEAILVLGMAAVRRIVLAITVARPLLTSAAERATVVAMWRVSVEAAALAQRLLGGGPQAELAFTAGMLHGFGRLHLMMQHGEAYASARALEGEALCAAERALCGRDHAEIGADLLQQWGLPGEIVLAVREHHASPLEVPAAAVSQGLWLACHAHDTTLPGDFWRRLPHIELDPVQAIAASRNEVEALESLLAA